MHTPVVLAKVFGRCSGQWLIFARKLCVMRTLPLICRRSLCLISACHAEFVVNPKTNNGDDVDATAAACSNFMFSDTTQQALPTKTQETSPASRQRVPTLAAASSQTAAAAAAAVAI